jgi:hypothetical protein
MILFGLFVRTTTHEGYKGAKKFWKILVILGTLGVILELVLYLMGKR